jgi:hypothetical protein
MTTTIINFCQKNIMSECKEKKDHPKQRTCSYYKEGVDHCGCLRFGYHCDNWEAQMRLKEKGVV